MYACIVFVCMYSRRVTAFDISACLRHLPLIPFSHLRKTSGLLFMGVFPCSPSRLACPALLETWGRRGSESECGVCCNLSRPCSTCRRWVAMLQVVCHGCCGHGLAEQYLGFLAFQKSFAWDHSVCLRALAHSVCAS